MARSASPSQPKLWTRDLVLIILVNLCVFTNHIMSISTFPFYIQALGGSEAVSGACAVLFSLVAVLVRPFVGWWLDDGARRGRRLDQRRGLPRYVGRCLACLRGVGSRLLPMGPPQRDELLEAAGVSRLGLAAKLASGPGHESLCPGPSL